MTCQLQQLIEVLDLETLDDSLFRGQNLKLPSRSIYGGQVIAQSLVAAARTVAGAPPHSLHAYFLRPGDWSRPVIYQVDRVRDGKSFTSRYVRAMQHGEVILSMNASFHRDEPGLEHQMPIPAVPPPEQLADLSGLFRRWPVLDAGEPSPEVDYAKTWPLQIRLIRQQAVLDNRPTDGTDALWFKTDGPMPENPTVHAAVLAYASDYNLLGTALGPHSGRFDGGDLMRASIDHAVWFHRPFRVDDWLLYSTDTPSAQSARGFARGLMHDRAGRLVASTAQEGLIRDLRLSRRG